MGKTKPPPKPKPAAKPAPPAVGAHAPAPRTEYASSLPLARIRPSEENPRKTFGDLDGLAASIREHGILQRPLVRPVGPAPKFTGSKWEGTDYFEVVAGERRFRAAALAGLAEIPVTVRVLTDDEARPLRHVENEQREDVRVSETAAAYARLAETLTAEQIAATVGKPLAYVRDLVRLARLPAWALAAVDAGTLPRATAALVAKVPGEESRKRAAACVLGGWTDPREIRGWEDGDTILTVHEEGHDTTPLSYRDTRELLATHFTRQLKDAPFSRKSLDLIPAAGSCDACPQRAGNDPEAKADGVRADVCLDPDCYRVKVAAYKAAEIDRAAKKGAVPVPEDFTWPLSFGDHPQPPRGWCLLDVVVTGTELGAEFPPGKAPPLTLAKVLGGDVPQQYLAFHRDKPRLLVRTGDARRALQAGGVLKKPERAKPAERPKGKVDEAYLDAANQKPPPGFTQEQWDRVCADHKAMGEAKHGKPLVPKVAEWEADERAAVIAAGVLREYGEEQCAALAELPDAAAGGPILDALRLVARAFAYDMAQNANNYNAASVGDVLKDRFPGLGLDWLNRSTSDKAIDPAIEAMTAPQLLGLLLQLAAAMELGNGPNRDTGEAMLDWAELDWPALTSQARRALEGGESAEEKLAGVEA